MISSTIRNGTLLVIQAYDNLMSKADPRVENLPLMDSPFPHTVIMVLYLMVIKLGPSWMKHKNAYELRTAMVIYNFSIVFWTVYMLYEFLASGWLTGYSLGCQPVDYSNSESALRMLKISYVFFISKLVELSDTVFFILRKKQNQVSFLHVFHHCAMPICWWWGVKFVPGGAGTFHGLLNCIVHITMYTYYGLSALGPAMQKYLFWKSYITKLQLVQFVLIYVHMAQYFFISCDYPVFFVVAISSYALIFLVLFANFYRQAYRNKSGSLKCKTAAIVANGAHSANGKFALSNGVDQIQNGSFVHDKNA